MYLRRLPGNMPTPRTHYCPSRIRNATRYGHAAMRIALCTLSLAGPVRSEGLSPDPDHCSLGGRLQEHVQVGHNLRFALSVGALADDTIGFRTGFRSADCGAGADPVHSNPQKDGKSILRFARSYGVFQKSEFAFTKASAGDDNARRAKRGSFDETRRIACAQDQGQPMTTCVAGVARSGDGNAAVVVTFANGFRRTLYFALGKFVRGDATMSGVGTDIEWRLEDALYHIRVDDQRFEIPEEMITHR